MGTSQGVDQHGGDGQPRRIAGEVAVGRPAASGSIMTGEAAVAGVHVRWAARTDVGKVRALNEDAILASPPVFVVADGMGGHDAGEVASALTVTRFRALAENAGDHLTLVDLVAYELRNVNGLLRDVETAGEGRQMGTTVVGIALVDHGGVPTWLAFNVGDSRAYCWADGRLRQISRDHSYVQELVDAGELAPEDVFGHEHRNIITRALGADPTVQPDYWVRPVQAGERFLLCSDGLTSEVGDIDVEGVLAAGSDPQQTVDALVDQALARGGHDNVSVIVVEVTAVDGAGEITTKTKPGRGRTGLAVDQPPTPAAAAPASPPRPDGDDEVIDLVPRVPTPPRPEDIGPVVTDGTSLIGSVPGLVHQTVAEEPPPPDAEPTGLIEAMPEALSSSTGAGHESDLDDDTTNRDALIDAPDGDDA